jgi:long-chain acyl-CoA synthetase
MSERTVVIAVMPLFHTLGLSGILNPTVRCGGAVVLMRQFDPEQVLRAVERHQATVLHGVPTMYHALLDHYDPRHHDTSSLGLCGSAGAPIPAELLDRIEQEFGVVILEGYGLTESGPAATFNRRGQRKPYSVGLPLWGVEVAVWGKDDEPVPSGPEHVGELVIRGHCTMRGYLNKPEATAEAFAGGWLHSGDLGYRDEDGFFFIVDRKKDMIIRGGYNVYPREVEEVLYTHPAVGEVAVVGVPDPRLGEEVKAFLTLRDGQSATEREIIDFAKERVAAYKYPRSVKIVAELPKGPTGKILKRELIDK